MLCPFNVSLNYAEHSLSRTYLVVVCPLPVWGIACPPVAMDRVGAISVEPGVQYKVRFEILRNDLERSDAYMADVVVDGQSMGECPSS